ncbi:MAG TPA: hypothetical protein VFA68_20150 [Terriglobales bacterium]|nr:hypothetical protein [Terriglobales bacterium]
MRALTLTCLLVLLAVSFAGAQHAHRSYPSPPEPAQKTATTSAPATTQTRRAADPLQLQREAREMLELSQSVQLEIDSLTRGLLPKDLSDKLKRIEKLSKHLRSQVEH